MMRRFVSGKRVSLSADFGHTHFQIVKPDFTLLKSEVESAKSRLWRDREAFCEVKASAKDSPNSTKSPGNATAVLVQAADYARLHMSASPFQLFSIGLLIFGDKFAVAYFDRGRAQVSPEFDMWEELPRFIRVVRCMTWHMSAIELGQDPTVSLVPGTLKESYPKYKVTMGGRNDDREWYTEGVPIWSSVSLFGRGTAIWKVKDAKNNKTLILKSYWHPKRRISESDIYKSVEGTHPALAKFEDGDDVHFPGEDLPISAATLRSPNNRVAAQSVKNDPILHRILLSTVGKPLWEADSEYELIRGMRDAIQGISDLLLRVAVADLHFSQSSSILIRTRHFTPRHKRRQHTPPRHLRNWDEWFPHGFGPRYPKERYSD